MPVVVIGGGILGASTAHALVSRGIRTVLVDAGPGGNPASARTFAWINAAVSADEHYHALRTQGLLRHATYSVPRGLAHFSGLIAWDRLGKAQPAQGDTTAYSTTVHAKRLADRGHRVRLVTRDEACRREPALNPKVLPDDNILIAEHEGWADVPGLVVSLIRESLPLGLRVVRDWASIVTEGSRVTGVKLSDGTVIATDRVVVAGGGKTTDILGTADVGISTRTNQGVVIRTEPIVVGPHAVIRNPDISLRAEVGGRLFIHSVELDEEMLVGLDREELISHPVVEEMVGYAQDALITDETVRVQTVSFGERPIPGDGLPAIGAVNGTEGLFVVFTHSGATLGLLLGELVAEAVEGRTNALLEHYSPNRLLVSA